MAKTLFVSASNQYPAKLGFCSVSAVGSGGEVGAGGAVGEGRNVGLGCAVCVGGVVGVDNILEIGLIDPHEQAITAIASTAPIKTSQNLRGLLIRSLLRFH
jgi:hypothetical protein